MKINKFIGLLACTMAFTACQNDMLEADMQQNKIYTLSGKMSTGKVMSRAQIELGNSNSAEEYAYWNEGDAFALYQNINDNLSTSVFTISGDYSEAGENPQSATFTTDNPAELGVEYVAVYPAGLTVNDGKVDMNFNGNSLDFSGATTEAERAATWKGYMNRYMYMLAQGKLVNGEPNVVSFQHLCAMFRVTYSNETEATKDISELSFTGDMFSNGITYNLKGRYQSGSGATSNYSTSFSGLTVQPGETVDLYVFLFPRELNPEGEVQVNLNINSAKQTVILPTSAIQAANDGVAGIEAGKRYWFKVTENAEGLVWNKDLNVEKITIKNVELSAALLSVLGSSNVTLDENGYAVINEPVVNSITKLDFNSYDERANITSLDGIGDFVNLEELYIDNAGLTTLKLSNPKLCKVSVESNKLTSLDVSGLSNLYYLSCAFNGELRGNMNLQGTVLREIRFQHTNATAVPEGLNTSDLVILDSGDNQLTELNLSEYTLIRDLYLARNQLSNETLLLPENNLLEILDISGNSNFTTFDLTQSPKLRYLWAGSNLLESLDTSKCPELNFISCHDNMLTALDLTANEKLSQLECGNQKNEINLVLTLTEAQKEKWDGSWINSNPNVTVKIAGADTVKTITIENPEFAVALQAVLGAEKVTINESNYGVMKEEDVLAIIELNFDNYDGTISTLSGIEYFTSLKTLYCRNVYLKECDFSQNVNLSYVNIQGNNLTSLDFSNCPSLTTLICSYMSELTDLNLSGCNFLNNLQAQSTSITSLEIPNPQAMSNFLVPSGLSVDLTLFTKLSGLGLSGRGLENLDMIPANLKEQLGYLVVDDNDLTSLNLTEYPKLWGLSCIFNKISSLDITSCSSLTSLYCGNQKNEAILTLTLTEEQKLTWDKEWGSSNGNVTLNVVGSGSTTEGGSNTTSGNDFNIEGIY